MSFVQKILVDSWHKMHEKGCSYSIVTFDVIHEVYFPPIKY